MNIELTELRELLLANQNTATEIKAEPKFNFWEIGANYFMRTVTHHHTGKLVAVTPNEILLSHAAWIADDGRFTQAVESGEFSEVEMFPAGSIVAIGRGSLIDAVKTKTIPCSQK